ncbi:MAG: hypothetical protein OHK0029_42030 [Armatimonadaceae bacterium]
MGFLMEFMLRGSLGVVAAGVVIGAPVWAQGSEQAVADRKAMVGAVREIIAPGSIPGPLAVWGKEAFVVLTGKENRTRLPMIAAARYGRGRVIAVGHGGFLGGEALNNPDNQKMIQGFVRWAGGGKAGTTVAVVGNGSLADRLTASGASIIRIESDTIQRNPQQLRSLPAPVLFMGTEPLDGPAGEAVRRELEAYVQRGGGVIMDGLGWGWKQLNPGKSLETDHGGNRFLRPMGLAFADGMFDRTGSEGWLADTEGMPLAHAEAALTALTHHAEGKHTLSTDELAQVTQVLSTTMGALPVEDRSFAPRVRALCTRYGGEAIPTRQSPVTTAAPFARLAAVLYAQEWKRLPVEQVQAHPSAASFPGAVPASAPRVTRTRDIDTTVPNWHSTGLYAAPGEVITFRLPADAVKRGLSVRIGSHTDSLWHLPKWERFPEVSTQRPLNAAVVRVASPFGGSVFIDVPGKSTGGTVAVTVENVVEAPLFVRGKTDIAEWKRAIRLAPGPWAELAANGVILSVPSAVVRDLEDPESLMAYWDEVMDRCYELYAAPRRSRPERYCVDRQISAGYMHSGYPIMTGDDVAKDFVNLAMLRSPEGRVWGFYHEMGHNFQVGDWTFGGTGEVTNNLFSLYGYEKLNGIRAGGHPNMASERIGKQFREYIASGASFDQWKRDPFLALYMYVQVQKEFGWEPFTKVFAEYRDLPASERPRSDDEKRSQWMVRLSRAVGKNLGPFFAAWGVPVSDDARQSLSELPVWLPDELKQKSER